MKDIVKQNITTYTSQVLFDRMNVDPLAEEYSSWSPYNYVYNNPLNFTDFSGMCPDGDCPDDPPDIYGGVLDEVVITNEPTGSGFINLQNRFAGSMDEWQQLTKEVFSSDNELADLQWQVSYGNAEQEYFQAQLDEQTSTQHRATSRAAELTMYVLPTPIVGLGALSKAPTLYRSAKIGNKHLNEVLMKTAYYSDNYIHTLKASGIDKTFILYNKLPPSSRRILYPAQKALLKEKANYRNFINTHNIETIIGSRKIRGGI